MDIGAARQSTTQTIAYDGNVAITNPFGPETFAIRVVSNSACHIAIGDGVQTASTSFPLLPANWVEYITVTPGQRISALKAATNGLITATAGTLWVTELT